MRHGPGATEDRMIPRSTRARYRRAMVAAALLAVAWLLWSARASLYPFIVAIIFAFVLAPIVDRVVRFMPCRRTRPQLARGVAGGYVYLVSVVLVVGTAVQGVPRVGDQPKDFASDVPT